MSPWLRFGGGVFLAVVALGAWLYVHDSRGPVVATLVVPPLVATAVLLLSGRTANTWHSWLSVSATAVWAAWGILFAVVDLTRWHIGRCLVLAGLFGLVYGALLAVLYVRRQASSAETAEQG